MYVAAWSFTAAGEGVEATEVRQGEQFADDHELVRLFPDKFRKVSDDRKKRPDVEQATNAPGEKRAVRLGGDARP